MGVVIPLEENKNKQASVKPLVDLTKSGMQRVNQLILSKAGSDVEMIPEVANHLISSGGKRLRPMLTLASAELCGYAGENHIRLAASVEFMHTATLLHDDVVDESAMRRGKSTARMIWGNQASVLVGDFLLGQAFKMMVEAGSMDALDVLATAATVIAEGEVMQLSAAKNMETTEDDYLAVIRAKTAALFAAAAEVGPIVAGESKAMRNALKSYGMNLGLAFQLVDDVLDYGGTTAELGKNTGDDFREGKITLPVILAYRRGSDEERAFWKRAIEEGQSSDENLAIAMGLIKKYGSWPTRLPARATTARSPAMRWPRYPTNRSRPPCSRSSTSASNGSARRQSPSLRRLAAMYGRGLEFVAALLQKSHARFESYRRRYGCLMSARRTLLKGFFMRKLSLSALLCSAALAAVLAGAGGAWAKQADAPAKPEVEVKFDPGSVDSFSGAYLAAFTADSDGDHKTAIELYRVALDFEPNNLQLQERLMINLFLNGDFEEGVKLAQTLKKDRLSSA